MNILIITQYFWPENFRINDLASGLREKGHTVSVLTGIPNYPDGKFYKGYGLRNKRCEDYGGIPLYRVPLAPRGKGTGFRLALNYLSFAVAASMWGPFLCKDKYDVIFVYEPSPITVGIPAIVMKRIKTAPVMFWMQDLWPESLTAAGAVRSKIVLKLFEVLVSIIYRSCDIILAQSRAFISNIRRVAGESKQVYYFPNSAEELYRPITVKPDARERMHMPPGFRVLFAGNIGAAQDFPTILETAEKLKDNPDIQWVILGDGRLHRWLDEQVEVRGLRNTVHLIGRHPAETMPRFFALADALLVTLKKEPIFSLTIPSKVQSYLACAKPVIAALDGEGA
ncbi:MAG TPA: glycosyltransferase family 4 protein, partial [candidate division Zixibacteria bacterium]|nr:glycosyltransferase family 4 protein [candidate division Zixibacteria bacterium]